MNNNPKTKPRNRKKTHDGSFSENLCLSALTVPPSLLSLTFPSLFLSPSRSLSPSPPSYLPLALSPFLPPLSLSLSLTFSLLLLLSLSLTRHPFFSVRGQVEIRKSANVAWKKCATDSSKWRNNQIICTVPTGAGTGEHSLHPSLSLSLSLSSFLSFLLFFIVSLSLFSFVPFFLLVGR